jgi:hypothetical protein
LLEISLPKLLDLAAVNAEPVIPGRININQASRTALMGIPGMDPETVDAILGAREVELAGDDSPQRHETWLLTQGLVDLNQMKQLLPYVCTGGDVYHAQVVGYFDEGGPASRVEVVVDASGDAPQVVFWRDISHLGRGWPLQMLGVSGSAVPEADAMAP